MKKMLFTLAAVLCCAMTIMMLHSCSKSEEELKSELVGTWTEQNNLFTDILTLNEDGLFSFQSHISRYNGSGSYVFTKRKSVGYITLNYNNKEPQVLEVRKLEGSTLELTDQYGNIFRLRRA